MIPAKYSYRWSMSVIDKLEASHPRGSRTCLRILRITKRDLGHFLATGDKIFPQLRNLVHFLDNAGRGLDDYYTDVEILDKIKSGWRCQGGPEVVDRIKKRLILEEQESRGGG